MFERFLSDKQVQARYVAAGTTVGGVISDVILHWFANDTPDFDRLRSRWAKWEREYARRGYRTISLEHFAMHGGYGVPLPSIGTKRAEGEKKLLYAPAHR